MYLTLILLIGNEQNNAVPVRKLFKKKKLLLVITIFLFNLKDTCTNFIPNSNCELKT